MHKKETEIPYLVAKMLEAKAYLIDVEKTTGKTTQSAQRYIEAKLSQDLQILHQELQKTDS
jgi:hypothetical protein